MHNASACGAALLAGLSVEVWPSADALVPLAPGRQVVAWPSAQREGYEEAYDTYLLWRGWCLASA